jgi:phosphoglycerate dehydrogenase-like enzyme
VGVGQVGSQVAARLEPLGTQVAHKVPPLQLGKLCDKRTPLF